MPHRDRSFPDLQATNPMLAIPPKTLKPNIVQEGEGGAQKPSSILDI